MTLKVTPNHLSEQTLTHLINQLYKILEEEISWEPFLQQLNDALGTRVIHMVAQDKNNAAISFSAHANIPVEAEYAYLHKYQFIEPRLQHLVDKAPGQWVHDHETVGEAVMAVHPFYQEYLLPANVKYLSVCKLIDDANATVFFGVFNSPSQGPVSQERIDFLNQLLPHMCRVCKLSLQNFTYSTQALIGHTLVNKLRQPVILVSVNGEVVHVNESAQRMLQATDLIRIEDGALQLPLKHRQTFLQECSQMEIASKHAGDHPDSSFKTLQITSLTSHKALYAFYTMLPPQRMMRAYGLRPLVMLFFYHPESAPKVDASLLDAAFGFTPSECRTAMLLAEGLSQKQIANRLGIKYDTIRKQLQAMYQKTSTRQQSELIRLMLHLPSNFVQQSYEPLA